MWLVSLAGCQYGKPNSANSTQVLDPGSQSVPPDTVITLERTACYGRCPDYTLMISGDGTVIYDGRQYVKHVGLIRGTITKDQVNQLIKEFERIKYSSLRDRYESVPDGCPTTATDHPWANTSIKVNGTFKAIKHYYGCQFSEPPSRDHVPSGMGLVYPRELVELESKIDEVVNTKQWIE